MEVEVWVDGSCYNRMLKDGSPMGLGIFILVDGCHEEAMRYGLPGGLGTNNIAEWKALQKALDVLVHIFTKLSFLTPITSIKIYSDSDIIVSQFNGVFKIKNEEFLPYYQSCRELAGMLGDSFKGLTWIPREKNMEADKLSKIGRTKQEML